MLKLNRATEYGLIALGYIRGKKPGELTSEREIADEFSLPFEILAKTLQRLKEQGIISSTYGTRGGYQLSKALESISFLDFLKMMEGPIGVVSCVTSSEQDETSQNIKTETCNYKSNCKIRPTMSNLNQKIADFFSRISLAELTTVSDGYFRATPAANNPIAAVSWSGDEP